MADNIIKRIVQLIWDKAAAKKAQDDAKETASGIDAAWKDMAKKIGGYLAAGFLIKQVIDFGKAAVKEAMESQAAWANLKGTVDATGASFDKIETRVRAAADAFQDATIHDDDAFAETMSRMVAKTGDVEASLNNMGLVANVAAQFFKGELEPAADLVAKAMNGNVLALRKMGIAAKDGQQALEILAQRSMGAATREASTFAGQLKQTDELWKDFLKATGKAIISSDGAADGISILRDAIRTMTVWVSQNRSTIRDWVTNGIAFAIDAADVFIRAVWGMGNALTGGFQTALGVAAKGVSFLVKGMEGVARVSAVLDAVLGNTDAMVSDLVDADNLHKQADAINDWADAAINAGSEKVKKGIDILSTPIFSSDQFKGGPPKIPPLTVNKPMVGKNVETDASKAVQKALEQFQQDAKSAVNMAKILGDQFDATGAEIDRTAKLLNVLAANGIDPARVGMSGLADRLKDLVTNIKPVEDATKALAKAQKTDAVTSALDLKDATAGLHKEQADLQAQMVELLIKGVDPQSEKFQALSDQYLILGQRINSITADQTVNRLKAQQGELYTQIKNLLDAGVDPLSKAVTNLIGQYDEFSVKISDAKKIQVTTDAYTELADTIRSNLFMASLDPATTALDRMTIEQDALKAAMQKMLEAGIKPTDKALQDLIKRYNQVSHAIKEQTKLMQLQSDVADVLAEALGAAITGGLHEAAVAKAKQNAIEAIEWTVRAGAFALLGNGPMASKAIATAGEFAAVAAMWGAFAVATGGFGGGAASGSGGSGGAGSGGSALDDSRSSSNSNAANAKVPDTEVSIYMVGPGFHALNPEVQRVVYGAQQQAVQRYGPNARVRLGPTG